MHVLSNYTRKGRGYLHLECRRPSGGFFIVVIPVDRNDLSGFNAVTTAEYPTLCTHEDIFPLGQSGPLPTSQWP